MSNQQDKKQKSPNVPTLRFRGFSDEWTKVLASSLFETLPNNTLSRDCLNYESGTYKNVHYGDVLTSFPTLLDTADNRVPYISSPSFLAKKTLMKGDVIIADTAEDYMVGKALEIAGCEGIKAVPGLHTIACRPKIPFSTGFLGYYLNSSTYKEHIKQYAQGIKVYSISKSNFMKISISSPSLNEQSKIGTFLALIDRKIGTQNKIIEEKKQVIKALNDTLYCHAEKSPFRFADVAICYSGLSGKNAEDFGEGSPYITYLNVLNNRYVDRSLCGYVSIKQNERQNTVRSGDVLLTLSSETPNEVGISSVYLGKEPLYLNSFCVGLRFSGDSVVIPEYAAWLFSTTAFRRHIFPFAQGSTRYNLNLGSFMASFFALPSIDEQRRFAKLLNSLEKSVYFEEEKLERLKASKSFFLQQLFI